MTSCENCGNGNWGEAQLEGSGIDDELESVSFCPAHRPVRCNLRYSMKGEELDEHDALRERRAVARDKESGAPATTIAERKAAREAKDDKRWIAHCRLICCASCLRHHKCDDDPHDYL